MCSAGNMLGTILQSKRPFCLVDGACITKAGNLQHSGWEGDRGLQGVVLRTQEEMRKKVEKWQEKGPAKQGRVLPVPDMEPKKRRGGKRARKYKERYGLTDTKKVRPPCCTTPPVQGPQ